MLNRSLKQLLSPALLSTTPRNFIGHIKNMNEEHVRAVAA